MTYLRSTTVHQILVASDLQPHRIRTFTFSPDPDFEAKLLDIVGLYLNPPEHALVLCVDEKTGIQALDRIQPLLPLSAKKPRSWTNEYVRHGTQTLLAALDIASGQVVA
jgi:putative transposase